MDGKELTIIEVRLTDGSIRRFRGSPTQIAEVYSLTSGPKRRLVVEHAEEVREEPDRLEAMVTAAERRASIGGPNYEALVAQVTEHVLAEVEPKLQTLERRYEAYVYGCNILKNGSEVLTGAAMKAKGMSGSECSAYAKGQHEGLVQAVVDYELDKRISALEALADSVPHKRVLAAFPIDGKEVRIELVERDHG